MRNILGVKPEHRLIIISFFLAAIAYFISFSYFINAISMDVYSWEFWIASVAVLIWASRKRDSSVLKTRTAYSETNGNDRVKMWLMLAALTAVYFYIRYMNYPTSPWNENGFYDDAAWDVYYMRKHAEGAWPSVQAVMYDSFVIGNVRELLFAWYLLPFFRLLGYNALTLNFACAVLGYVAVIFTALTAKRLFRSIMLGLLAGVLLTLNPFHFAHTYMGERYAMAPTLLIVSVYFLTCAVQDKSARSALLGGLFTALCVGSGKTGKEYFYGVAVAALIYTAFNIKRLRGIKSFREIKGPLALPAWYAGGFLTGFAPYIAFIAAYPDVYNSRETGLITEFFNSLYDGGGAYLFDRVRILFEALFSPDADGKQYTRGYPLISKWHGVLVFAGAVIAFIRGRYVIFVMCALPAAALAVAPFYDYRLYISTPVWILAIVFTIHAVLNIRAGSGSKYKYMRLSAIGVSSVMLVAGCVTGMTYLAAVTKEPLFQYLNNRENVGIMRCMQDIIIGAPPPSVKIKKDEFRRNDIPDPLPKNYLVAPKNAFGVGKLYLCDFPEDSVGYLAKNINFFAMDVEELIENVRSQLDGLTDYSKDLCIIVQNVDKIKPVLETIKAAAEYGTENIIDQRLDGVDISVYTLDIPKENIEDFKGAALDRL